MGPALRSLLGQFRRKSWLVLWPPVIVDTLSKIPFLVGCTFQFASNPCFGLSYKKKRLDQPQGKYSGWTPIIPSPAFAVQRRLALSPAFALRHPVAGLGLVPSFDTPTAACVPCIRSASFVAGLYLVSSFAYIDRKLGSTSRLQFCSYRSQAGRIACTP